MKLNIAIISVSFVLFFGSFSYASQDQQSAIEAVMKRKFEGLKGVLSLPANTFIWGEPLLNYAINGMGQTEPGEALSIVKLLVEKGLSPTFPSSYGCTPLQCAASVGQVEVAEFLIQKGADVRAQMLSGWEPIHAAARSGKVELVKLLVGAGALTTVSANGGHTPLHEAAGAGHLEVVQFLLENGAELDVVCDGGFTPLHFAASAGRLAVVRAMIAHLKKTANRLPASPSSTQQTPAL